MIYRYNKFVNIVLEFQWPILLFGLQNLNKAHKLKICIFTETYRVFRPERVRVRLESI